MNKAATEIGAVLEDQRKLQLTDRPAFERVCSVISSMSVLPKNPVSLMGTKVKLTRTVFEEVSWDEKYNKRTDVLSAVYLIRKRSEL